MGTATAAKAGGEWAESAYEAIAPVYDAFTAHHDDEAWLAELLGALERHGLPGLRLLDVGCGTGKSFLPLLERGWEVTACDISPAMLELARAKAGDRARLVVADMLALPHFGEFDLVWALDDAINYLLDDGELDRALAGMRRNLAPDGLLLFDLNTLRTYRTFFAETAVVEQGGRRMIWRGMGAADAPPRSIGEARFELEPDDPANATDGGDVPAHVHRQRHFPEADVLTALDRAGLECFDVYGLEHDGVLRQPLDESVHTKAVFIARPARAPGRSPSSS